MPVLQRRGDALCCSSLQDAQYLAFYDKVATKALSDPDQWHPIAKHLPETMSIELGVMYH